MRKRLQLIVPSALLFAITFFLYGPISLYYGNQRELWFPFSFIALKLILVFLVVLILLVIISLAFHQKHNMIFAAVIFGLGLAFWFEGTIMPMDYGKLDGSYINWANYTFRIFIDSVVWLICIITPIVLVVKKERMAVKIITVLCILLITMQSAALLFFLYNLSKEIRGSNILTDEGKYSLSTNNNIIVLILDSFDNAVFDRIINDNPEYKSYFNDFTL